MGFSIALVLTAVLTLAFSIVYTEVRAKRAEVLAVQHARMLALIAARRTGDTRLAGLLEEMDRPRGEDGQAEFAQYLGEGLTLFERGEEVEADEAVADIPEGDDLQSLIAWISHELARKKGPGSAERAA